MKKDTRLPRMSCPFFYCLTLPPTLNFIKEYTLMKFKFFTFLLILFIGFSSCQENGTNDSSQTTSDSALDELFSKNPVDRLDERDLKSVLNLSENVRIHKSSYQTGENGEAGLIEYKWNSMEGKKEKVSLSFLEQKFTKKNEAKGKLNLKLTRGTFYGKEKIKYETVSNLGEGASWSPRLKQLCWYKGNTFYTLTSKGKPGEGDFLAMMTKIALQFD